MEVGVLPEVRALVEQSGAPRGAIGHAMCAGGRVIIMMNSFRPKKP